MDPSVGTGFCSPCLCGPELGAGGLGVRLFPPGTRKRGDFRSVSLFRENLCSPGVLPELRLLLGYLPKWGETGNSLRFRERYGRRGGGGGDRLPDGPRARRERLGGQGGRTARSPGPTAATRRRRSGLATWAPGTRRNRSGGVVLDHGRALPAGEKAGHPGAPVHRLPPVGLCTVAERPSAPAWQWAPCSPPHGSCGGIALPPQSLCVHVSEALVAGGCRHWLVAQRLGAGILNRCDKEPPRRGLSAVASNPILESDAQATDLVKGNPSGSFGRERTARWPESSGGQGDSCALLASNTRGGPGATLASTRCVR